MRSRRTFTAEFKREAVRQLMLGDKTASEIARELAIPRTKLYSWRDELERKLGDRPRLMGRKRGLSPLFSRYSPVILPLFSRYSCMPLKDPAAECRSRIQ